MVEFSRNFGLYSIIQRWKQSYPHPSGSCCIDRPEEKQKLLTTIKCGPGLGPPWTCIVNRIPCNSLVFTFCFSNPEEVCNAVSALYMHVMNNSPECTWHNLHTGQQHTVLHSIQKSSGQGAHIQWSSRLPPARCPVCCTFSDEYDFSRLDNVSNLYSRPRWFPRAHVMCCICTVPILMARVSFCASAKRRQRDTTKHGTISIRWCHCDGLARPPEREPVRRVHALPPSRGGRSSASVKAAST